MMRFFPVSWRCHARKITRRTILELRQLESRESPTSMLTGPGSVVNTAAITIATLAATRQASAGGSGTGPIERALDARLRLDTGRGHLVVHPGPHHTAPPHGRGSHSTAEQNASTQAHEQSGIRDAVGSVIPDPLEHFQSPVAHGRVPHAVSFGESGGGGGGGGGGGAGDGGGGGGGGAPPAPPPDHGAGGPPAATKTHPGKRGNSAGSPVMHFNAASGGSGSSGGLPNQTTPEDFRAPAQSLPTVPVAFTINSGQAPGPHSFYSQGPGYNLFLGGSQALFSLPGAQPGGSDQLTLAFAGANAVTPIAGAPLTWRSNYFTGNGSFVDQQNFASVSLPAVYSGIDVVYYGSADGQFEYDLNAAPYADVSQVRMQFQGAASMHTDKAGSLVLTFADGASLVEHAPVAYQPNATGGRDSVNSSFVLNPDGSVGFTLGNYDPSKSLTIDPQLVFASYFGGSGQETGNTVTVATDGSVFVTGTAPSLSSIYTDSYIAHFASDGRSLIYVTYFDGSGSSSGNAVNVDPAGNAVLVGTTAASNYPVTTGAVQTSMSGPSSGYVTRLNATGDNLLYSSFFNDTTPNSVAVDALGEAYVSGQATSGMSTTTGAYQTSFSGTYAPFIAKFNAAGTSLLASTYVGGTGLGAEASANSIAVDSSGNAYIAGAVVSGSYPTTVGAYQTTGGAGDAFVTKVNSSLSALSYSTYLGSSTTVNAIAVNLAGDAYVTGGTLSSSYPTTTGAYQTSLSGLQNAFITEFNAAGSALVYSSYFGSGSTQANALALSPDGTAFIAGATNSSSLPTTSALGGTGWHSGGGSEAFLTQFNAAGTSLLFSTYLGTTAFGYTSVANALTLDPVGNIYVAGSAGGGVPTTTGAYQTTYGGGGDAFLMKIDPGLDPPILTGISPSSTTNAASGFITDSGNISLSGTSQPSVTVRLYLDTVPIGTTTANSFGSWSFNYTATTLADGTYDFTMRSESSGKNSLLSPAQLVTVDTTAPTVTLTLPSSPVTLAPVVTVQAADLIGIPANATVTLDVDLNNDGNFTDAGESGYATGTLVNGFAAIPVALSAAGTYQIRARVTDLAGNQATTAAQSFTIGSVASPWTLTDAVIRTSELAGGSPDLQLGDMQLAEPLDLDRSPGTSQSLDPALIYNSSMVNVKPIVQATLITDNAVSLPATFTATLTWNGTAQTPVTFSTTGDHPGDTLTFAVQSSSAVTGVSRNDWSLSVTITGHGTVTASGTAFVVAEDASPFGAGWSFSNLNQLVYFAASGSDPAGELWVYGDGSTRFFSGTSGTLTGPPEDTGSLVVNTGGSFTYTAADGSVIDFNSSGQQTDYISPDAKTSMTYSYTSGLLTSLTALDGAVATFTYSSGALSSVSVGTRSWSTTMSSGDLTQFTMPDTNYASFTYSSHLMTDASQGTIANHWAYNSAGLLTTLRWGNSSSPSTTTLASAAGQGLSAPVVGSPVATETDPLGSVTSSGLDDKGRLLSQRDAIGGLTTWTRNSAGQVTGTTDALGNTTTYTLDSLGYVTQVTLPDSNTIQYTYQTAYHAMLTMTDENGKTTTFTYDSLGHLLTITDAASEVTTNAYSSTTGLLTSTEDAMGRYTTYTYDADRRVSTVTTQLGTSSYTYDSTTAEIATVEDANSHTSTMSYDAMGRITGLVTPDGYSEAWTYSSAGLQTSFTDKNSTETDTTYDADGRGLVASTTAAANTLAVAVTLNTYDNAGQQIATTDPVGLTTQQTLDALGQPVTVTDPLGHVSRNVYDLNGEVTDTFDNTGARTHYAYCNRGFNTAVTDEMGNTVTNTFDPAGNLTQTEDPLTHVTSLGYDSVNRLVTSTDALTHTTTYAYWADGELKSVTNPRGYVTSTTYDYTTKEITTTAGAGTSVAQTTTEFLGAAGNMVAFEDGRSNTTTYTLNAVNDVTAIENPLTDVTTITRDHMSNVTALTDANSHTATYTLNALGQTTEITDATSTTTQYVLRADGATVATIDGAGDTTYAMFIAPGDWGVSVDPNGYQTREQFDAAGRPISLTDSVGNTTMWQYARNGNVTDQIDPNASTVTWTYNGDNQVTARTDELGRSESFSYDAVGQLTTELWKNSSGTAVDTFTYSYDANNNMLTATDNAGTYTLTYDALDRLATQTDIWALTMTFSYDAANNLTGVADSLGGTVTNTYNTANQLTEKQFSDTGSHTLSVGYTYDAAGELAQLNRYSDANATTLIGYTSYGYDNAGRTTSITHKNAGGTTIDSYNYTYDAAGRVATESSTLAPSATYSYDRDSQLLSDGTSTYAYDANGNRNYGSYATTTGNELTTDGTWNYSYDNAGNLTQRTKISTGEVWLYTYDNANRLIEADHKPSSGGSVDFKVTYEYDVFGTRVSQSVYPTGSGTPTVTDFAYDPIGNCWADLTSGGALITRRVFNPGIDDPLARFGSGGTEWDLKDVLGNVRDYIGSGGALDDHRDYDSFGKITTETHPSYGDRYGWTGREFDSETDLQYNRARSYYPGTGRFTTQDPVGLDAGDSNLYRYANNDAPNSIDPSGMDPPIRGGWDQAGPPPAFVPPPDPPIRDGWDPRHPGRPPSSLLPPEPQTGITADSAYARNHYIDQTRYNDLLQRQWQERLDWIARHPSIGEMPSPWYVVWFGPQNENTGMAWNIICIAGGSYAALRTPTSPALRPDTRSPSSNDGVPNGARYAQTSYSNTFSPAGIRIYSRLAGRPINTVDDLVAAIRAGEINPVDIPVIYIVRPGGNTLIYNTRTGQALEQAGIPRSQWNGNNQTGNRDFERRLSQQLQRNNLTNTGMANPVLDGGR
jgi:RHS repeat-associated protein